MGENLEDVISSFYINVFSFPKGTSIAREKTDVFGHVVHISDLGVFPFTGPKLETISKLLVALKCPHFKLLSSKLRWE